jgi:hypothetical protein
LFTPRGKYFTSSTLYKAEKMSSLRYYPRVNQSEL